MRSRRLPLGSPSKSKDHPLGEVTSGSGAATTDGEGSTGSPRARARQAPPASGIDLGGVAVSSLSSTAPTSMNISSKDKDKNASRTRRSARGLPLSRSSSHASAVPSASKSSSEDQVETPKEKIKTPTGKATVKKEGKRETTIAVKKEPGASTKPSGATGSANSKKRSAPSSSGSGRLSISSSVLRGIRPDGSQFKVKLLINKKVYTPHAENHHAHSPKTAAAGGTKSASIKKEPKESPKSFASDAVSPNGSAPVVALGTVMVSTLGNDGNQYYCAVCGEFGDVICCDGCPKVYHQDCIPLSHEPPNALDDEEPWYCPVCTTEGKDKNGSQKAAVRRISNQPGAAHAKKHADAAASAELEATILCDVCNKVMTDSRLDKGEGNVCSACLSGETGHEGAEENGAHGAAADSGKTTQSEKRVSKKTILPMSESRRPERERKRKTMYEEEDEADKSHPKKKKKKKRAKKDSLGSTASAQTDFIPPPPPTLGQPDLARATPAFYFYLTENRWKIERVLARNSRAFARTTKGGEKNAMVAAEAAIWWSKLRPGEHKRYIDMSMRDFEGRIIEWKEDKNIREMRSDGNADISTDGHETRLLEEDVRLTWKRHQRLYLSTSVGSKPFKPEPDQAYNRVLQDLLHDMRFHPLPMLGVDRPEEEKDEESGKVLIPFFDVHGPSSTSLGDACLGCMRSWNHFCPVLQRRVPAVEHRARLQPPMSSLLATRIGLGLRPRLDKAEEKPENPDKNADLCVWKTSKEREEMNNLPVLPSYTLDNASDRVDDIVLFVEETTAMKIPEPSRPQEESHSTAPKPNSLRSLPLAAPKAEEDSLFKKCGRCRTIIQGDTGCVQCRRAQLVINMAKRQKQEGKLLKVHTSMLGRYNAKEAGETQSTEDQAVAAAMLRERWTPSSVLQPQPRLAPGSSLETRKGYYGHPDLLLCQEVSDNQAAEAEEEAAPPIETGSSNVSASEEQQRSQRSRPNRMAAMPHDGFEPGERQEMLEKNRKAVNAFQKKVVAISCYGMLQALLRRDPLKLFDQPVTAEGYFEVVKNPILFSNIRSNVISHQYQSLGAFSNDVKLLCENALAFNLPDSIYSKTATEMLDLLAAMQKRSSAWVTAVKDAYSSYLNSDEAIQRALSGEDVEEETPDAAFDDLRRDWPEAVDLLEMGDWLKDNVSADFLRTEENEMAFFGSLSVSRVARAAEASLATYTDTGGHYGVVTKRSHKDDAALRAAIDEAASTVVGPLSLSTPSTWREESVHRLLRKVQSRRLDRMTASKQGCARCDGLIVGQDVKLNMKADAALGKIRKNEDSDLPRVDGSRIDLTTGRASAEARSRIMERRKQSLEEEQYRSVKDSCVSVRGSRIHGLGLFADQEFRKGDAVAEYVGEYIGNSEFEAREASYRERRIQDYSFRINSDLVIDATCRGGPGRYANHDCNPNCISKIISGEAPNEHLKRVMIVATRNIRINEEITYDYQFPLEQDLSARVPCNCRSDECRGFMNWDLPEKGSNNRAVLVQKRGANMRDRIRRLNRPLKRDEM